MQSFRFASSFASHSASAQALYHQCGFLDVGYRKRYYEDNKEDALIMYREFSYEEE